MRITCVVLLCSISAALASPTGLLIDSLMGEIMQKPSDPNSNCDDIPYSLRSDFKFCNQDTNVINFRRPAETIKERPVPVQPIARPEPVVQPIARPEPVPPRRRPRPGRPRNRPVERPREDIETSRSESSSSSGSKSSGSKMAYESELKSFENYLARFMQRCPVPPACYEPIQQAICGADERRIIDDPSNLIPNQWICQITVEVSDGTKWYGTGFKVNISPDIGRTVLFTAAHILRDSNGGYVPGVRIHCPNEPEVTVRRETDRDMWMNEEFLNVEDFNYDVAYITYPGSSSTGFGFQAYLDVDAMKGTSFHACGYPSPKRQDTCIAQCTSTNKSPPDEDKQYCHAGELFNVNDYKMFVNADFDFGETGGPLYEDTADNFVAFGIISRLGCPARQYQRLTPELLYEMFNHMGGIDLEYFLRGADDVYLHMDGEGLDGTLGNTVGGSVYAGFLNNKDDTINIVPVMQTSSNMPDTQVVAIRAGNQKNIFLSLDGTGVTEYLLRGGGSATCRYGIEDGAMETFYKEEESDGQLAFRSTTFNNVYLRVDHWHVKTPTDRGQVNAQFGKYTLETNHPERVP